MPKAKYKLYSARLTRLADNASVLHNKGLISESVARHLIQLAQTDEEHPRTGVVCHCGEVHAERPV